MVVLNLRRLNEFRSWILEICLDVVDFHAMKSHVIEDMYNVCNQNVRLSAFDEEVCQLLHHKPHEYVLAFRKESNGDARSRIQNVEMIAEKSISSHGITLCS